MKRIIILVSVLLAACQAQSENSIEVPMFLATTSGQGEAIGSVTITQTAHGLLFTPHLKDLPAGGHGFHIHEHPDCAAGEKDHTQMAAMAAGGHLDPKKTGKHEGPYANGHLGDLPVLYVDNQGISQTPVLAPRLSQLGQINHTTLMIHEGGDNYSDQPKPLGGAGARIACGVITF